MAEDEDNKDLERDMQEKDSAITPKEEKQEKKAAESAEKRLERAMLKSMGGETPTVKHEEHEEEKPMVQQPKEIKEATPAENEPLIFALRTTANREDQVMDFITGNIAKKKNINVYSVIRPHGMRGYIFIEAETKTDAELASQGIPYARGILPKTVGYNEIEHMLEQVKHEVDIRKNDIAEIISGPFKREKCKITRIDKAKEEVVVELLEAAVPIPITVKMDAVKVIRRDSEGGAEEELSS